MNCIFHWVDNSGVIYLIFIWNFSFSLKSLLWQFISRHCRCPLFLPLNLNRWRKPQALPSLHHQSLAGQWSTSKHLDNSLFQQALPTTGKQWNTWTGLHLIKARMASHCQRQFPDTLTYSITFRVPRLSTATKLLLSRLTAGGGVSYQCCTCISKCLWECWFNQIILPKPLHDLKKKKMPR